MDIININDDEKDVHKIITNFRQKRQILKKSLKLKIKLIQIDLLLFILSKILKMFNGKDKD